MALDDVREAAKSEIRHRLWAAERGKATRAYIREHPELSEEFEQSGKVSVDSGSLPQHVTVASITLELAQRARRRETARAVKQWAKDHPEEAQRIKAEVASRMQKEAEARA